MPYEVFLRAPAVVLKDLLVPGLLISGQLMSRFFIVTLPECRSVTPACRKLSAPERMPYPPQTPMLAHPALEGHCARGPRHRGLCVKTRMA